MKNIRHHPPRRGAGERAGGHEPLLHGTVTRSAAQTGRYSPDNPEEGGTGVIMEKRLERLLKAELRKSRILGWQEEQSLPPGKVLTLMEKAYAMGKADAKT